MGQWVNAVSRPERFLERTRRYHFMPIYKRNYAGIKQGGYRYFESGRSPQGAFQGQTIFFNEGKYGRRQEYRFRMADGESNRPLKGSFRFRIFHCLNTDTVLVDVNGNPIPKDKIIRRENRQDKELPWTWFEIDLHQIVHLDGKNTLGLTWFGAQPKGYHVPYMEELDISVNP